MKSPGEEQQVEEAIAKEVSAAEENETRRLGHVALEIPDNIILGQE